MNLEHFFDGLSTPMLLATIGAALTVLARGADRLVDNSAALAARLGMPPVIVGATIVALGTTMPECAVSVLAAWSGRPGLALGNAVGSIVADTALIFGICALMVRLPADRFTLRRQGWVQFASAALLAVLCYASFAAEGQAAALDRGAGALLLLLLVAYLRASVGWGRSYRASQTSIPVAAGAAPAQPTRRLVGGMVIALVLVVASSDVLIDAVSVLAIRVGVPQVVIAATLVALGTSLPELIVGVTAVRKGQLELVVGNLIGADILNVLFVIGASAVAAPLPVIDAAASLPELFLVVHIPAMLLVLAVFRLLIRSAIANGQFSRWMGVPLVGLYAAYLVVQAFFELR